MASRREELKVDLVANDQLSKKVDDAAGKVDKLDGREAKVELDADDNATEVVEEAAEAVEGLDGAEAEAELSADDQATAAAEDAAEAVEALDDVTGTATADLDDQATDAVGDVEDAVVALDDVTGTATADLTDNATEAVADVQGDVEALDEVTGTATVEVEVDDADMSAVEDTATAVEQIEGDHGGTVALEGAGETSEVTGSIVDNLTEAFGPGGLVAGGVLGLAALGIQAADDVGDIETLSEAVGGTTEEVSALLDAWDFVGGSADSLEATIIRVNDKLRDETNGLAEQLGINITDAKTPLDLFIEAVGVLNGGQLTANERLAIAMDLFGRKGALVLNDLQTQVGDLQTAMDEAGEEVLVHESDVEAARGVREQWDAIGDRVGELQRNLLPGLLPILDQAAGILDDILTGGREGGDIGGVGGALPDSIQDIVDAEEAVDDFWAGVVTAAVTGADETVAAVGTIGEAAEEIPEIMSPVSDALEDAADKAGDLADNLSSVLDPGMELAEAVDQLEENIEELTSAVEENGTSLSQNTAAGRANREQIRKNITGALDYAEALVANGASASEAQAYLNDYRTELVAQLTQLGLNDDEVNAYIDSLGLTPENVATAIELTGEDAANDVIERHNANLDLIPPEVSSLIRAYVKDGDIASANAALDQILDPQVRVRINLPGLPRIGYSGTTPYYDYTGGTGPVALARGAYVPNDMLAQLHANEVVLPLSDPRRMQQLLGMSEVGPPVAAALGRMLPAPSVAAAGAGVTMHVTVNMPPGSNGADVVRALQQEQRRLGPLPIRVAQVG